MTSKTRTTLAGLALAGTMLALAPQAEAASAPAAPAAPVTTVTQDGRLNLTDGRFSDGRFSDGRFSDGRFVITDGSGYSPSAVSWIRKRATEGNHHRSQSYVKFKKTLDGPYQKVYPGQSSSPGMWYGRAPLGYRATCNLRFAVKNLSDQRYTKLWPVGCTWRVVKK